MAEDDKIDEDGKDDEVMNDDFGDDFESFDDEFSDDFSDFDTGDKTLGSAFQGSPLFKVGIIAGGVVAIIAGVMLFGGGGGEEPDSFIRANNEGVQEAPGGGNITENYRQALEEENQQRVETAIQTRGSAIPIPIETGDTRLAIPDAAEEQQEDPLERWRRIQEERAAQEAERQQVQQALNLQNNQAAQQQTTDEATARSQAIEAMAEAMSQQMQSILEQTSGISSMQQVDVTDADFYVPEPIDPSQIDSDGDGTPDVDEPVEETLEIVIPAGSIEYAQLLTEANSDAGGPILAQIVSGPLAGSRMLGTFSTQRDFLVLNFNSVVVDGEVISTTAVALNPDTANSIMVTSVDKRYWERIILPAAARFVEGVGSAIAESATSTTTVDGGTGVSQTSSEDLDIEQELAGGVEEAASQIAEVLEEEGSQTQPLIIVKAGTPMGLLFTQPVAIPIE